MATEIMLTRVQGNKFAPADQNSSDSCQSIKLGTTVRAVITQPRNLRLHRKYFALLNLGFDYWEPPKAEWKGIEAVKNFDTYREQVQILAGYRVVTYNLDGSIKVVSESISFAKMDEERFQKLYKSVFYVIWRTIISKLDGWSQEEMQRVLNNLEEFA